jgi:ABC-2 type transport system ATP-binding protein
MGLIILENVTKIYRRSHLGKLTESIGVEGLNLSIVQGEVFGLLGLNGAGKTTTIKLMLGLLYPTKGSITVDGHLMPDMESLKKIGYLPEAAYLNKYLTGRETVELFIRLSGANSRGYVERAGVVLEQVGMTRYANKRLSEYSKGMLQRISIAQALAHDPDMLVFDEPITGLDPLALKEVRELILWLKLQGKTVFFSSHNISEVEKVCTRIGIMVNGKLTRLIGQKEWVQQEGRLEQIFIETVRGSEGVGQLSFLEK